MKYKLICFDMDGVIFQQRNFWIELHKTFGTLEKGNDLTNKYLHKNYKKLVEEVVNKLWKGKSADKYYELVSSLHYTRGVQEIFEFVKENNMFSAIISGGVIDAARRVQKDYGVDYIFANELVIKENKINGEFIWPIGYGKEKKVQIIKSLVKDLDISLKEVIYIGDSDADINTFKEVGLSIAFNSDSEELKKVATHVVDSDYLGDVIKYLKA